MKIGYIGDNSTVQKWVATGHTWDAINGHKSLLDFDVILFDPTSYTERITSSGPMQPAALERALHPISRRLSEIAEADANGRLVIIVVADAGNAQVYASGGVSKYTLNNVIFPRSLELERTSGKNIQQCHEKSVALKQIAAMAPGTIQYNAAFKEVFGKSFLKIAKSQKVIACADWAEDRRHVYFPAISGEIAGAGSAFTAVEMLVRFAQELDSELILEPDTLPLAESRYETSKEATLKTQVNALETQRLKFEEEITIAKAALNSLKNQKHLFLSNGDPLERAVRQALLSLGFNVHDQTTNRVDIRADYRGLPVVVEVKGREKRGAGERDGRQLETWISDYALEKDASPKGILVVNGYKDLSIPDRTEPIFPHSMHAYCIAREHCLITGLQLFCLQVIAEADPTLREKIAKKLLATSGLFDDEGELWTSYLAFT